MTVIECKNSLFNNNIKVTVQCLLIIIHKENIKLLFLFPGTSYENAMNAKVTSNQSSFHLYQSYYRCMHVHVSAKDYVYTYHNN